MRLTEISIAILIGAVMACGGVPPSGSPGLAPFLAALGEIAPPNKTSVDTAKRLHIYIDTSQSMKGFVAIPGSRYRRALEQLLDRTIAGGYEVSLYGFDKRVSPLPRNLSAAKVVGSSEFFSGAETSFPELFGQIRTQRKRGEIAIVLTDLVQSGQTGEQRELARAFQNVAKEKPEVLLLALRSAFVGSYWPESRPVKGGLRLDFQTENPKKSRPFYFLFIADTSKDLETLGRRLGLDSSAENPQLWQLDASKPAAIITHAEFRAPDVGGGWRQSRAPEELEPRGRVFRKAYWLVNSEDSPAVVQFDLRDDKSRGMSLERAEHIEIQARQVRIENGQPAGVPSSVRLNASIVRANDHSMSVRVELPPPASATWEGYHLQFLPGEANLARPIQLDLWTTDSDGTELEANRTYKLDLFVNTMVNALREPMPFAELYVFLGRGE